MYILELNPFVLQKHQLSTFLRSASALHLLRLHQDVYTYITAALFHIHQHCCSHCVPQDGWTALMLASSDGHKDTVSVLLSAGAQADLQDEVRYSTSICVRVVFLYYKEDHY